jgi:hypothetical protein
VDPETNEAYIPDGSGSHRLIVYDADTGKFRRMRGAYLQQFRNPVHCSEIAKIAKDGLVHVFDRTNDRIQVSAKTVRS